MTIKTLAITHAYNDSKIWPSGNNVIMIKSPI